MGYRSIGDGLSTKRPRIWEDMTGPTADSAVEATRSVDKSCITLSTRDDAPAHGHAQITRSGDEMEVSDWSAESVYRPPHCRHIG